MVENKQNGVSLGDRRYQAVLYRIVDNVRKLKELSEADKVISDGIVSVKKTAPFCAGVPADVMARHVKTLWYDKEFKAAVKAVEIAKATETASIVDRAAHRLQSIGIRRVPTYMIADDIRQQWYTDMMASAVKKVREENNTAQRRLIIDREALYIKGTELGETQLFTDIKNQLLTECQQREIEVALY
jgi:hypothetical protein